MWPFKKKAPEPARPDSGILAHPRYGKDPMALFFEGYVLGVLGYLPPDRDKAFQTMELGHRLKTKATEWREVVKESLHLSETIDIAILDLWFRNSAISEKQGHLYDPQSFAQDFVDQYNAPDSRVDIWPEGALEAAKQRIADAQQKRTDA
jgi:hypothetical protein